MIIKINAIYPFEASKRCQNGNQYWLMLSIFVNGRNRMKVMVDVQNSQHVNGTDLSINNDRYYRPLRMKRNSGLVGSGTKPNNYWGEYVKQEKEPMSRFHTDRYNNWKNTKLNRK